MALGFLLNRARELGPIGKVGWTDSKNLSPKTVLLHVWVGVYKQINYWVEN